MMRISIDDVSAAAARIADHVLRTPVVSCPALGDEVGCELFFKCENLQHVGAFKARGACNAVFSLSDKQAAAGVVAHSSGNHAAALARAASIRGIDASIVMPKNSATNKVAAVRAFGVEPVFCDATTAAREQAAAEVINNTGATLIHPYDNADVIAGQGTVALELLDQLAAQDCVLAPIGGGGLMAGTLTVIKALRPEIEVIGTEPECADDTFRSWKSGERQDPVRFDSIGDGLRTAVGRLTLPIIIEHVDDILTVTEDAIVRATRTMLRRTKLVVEPSSAVPLAAVTEHPARFAGKRVAIILSGGNLDWNAFPVV